MSSDLTLKSRSVSIHSQASDGRAQSHKGIKTTCCCWRSWCCGGDVVAKVLNMLFVQAGCYLSRDGERVVVSGRRAKFRMPVHNLEGIATFGYTGASPGLMELCANRGVAITFLSQSGRFMARVTGRVSGNVLLRRRQYRVADSEDESARIASDIIVGKISN